MSFDRLGLSAAILRAVAEQGYTTPTPVQQQAIPAALAGRDLMAGAQTGTGKTAGFALPILHRLNAEPARETPSAIRCLVLTPTRELAAQVEQSFRDYGKYLVLRTSAMFGGVSPVPQIKALRRGVDILVATPGRLLDHVNQRNVDLSQVEVLVLDEADRMLDMGFIRDVRKILQGLPAKRQTLLFSATFSKEIKRLADEFLHRPERIEMAHNNRPVELVSQRVYSVAKRRKRELLSFLIGSENWQQVLVFTRTRHGANRLATQLETDGLKAVAIHSNKSQGARTRALADFKTGRVRVLVATDIAARGLDIDQLPYVVNYELPNVPEDYVHRIGRTGRAGREGEAVSLVCGEERKYLAGIERLLKRELPKVVLEGYESDPEDTHAPPQPAQARRGHGRSRNASKSASTSSRSHRGKRSRRTRRAPASGK
ncbi:MAG: DEAD/DEAH box helicase [Gammaproteobacteria bacterium]